MIRTALAWVVWVSAVLLWMGNASHAGDQGALANSSDNVKLEDLGAVKVTPQTMTWKTEATSVLKNVGGLFTKVEGPRTSRPLITVLPLTASQMVNPGAAIAPVVDGTIDDREYAPWASTIGPLRTLADGMPTRDRTYAYVTCDDKKLYLAWNATYRGERPPAIVKAEQRDGPCHNDDCVEVLFAAPSGSLYHFIGNSLGAIYDLKDDAEAWNGKWEYKTSIQPDVWQGELAIAWTDLGLAGPPGDGTEWLLDLCRTSVTHAEQSKWCWRNGVAGFVGKEYMGRLRFDSKGWSFHLEPPSDRLGSNTGKLYVPMSAHRSGSLIAGLTVFDETGKEIVNRRDTLTPGKGEPSAWSFSYDLPRPGVYTYSMSIQDPITGSELFQLTVPLDVRADLQVAARVLPFRKKLAIEADASRVGSPDDATHTLRIKLFDKDARVLREAAIPRVAVQQFRGIIGLDDFAPGAYQLVAALAAGDGKALAEGKMELTVPARPDWLGNNLGQGDKVLPPFTPVKVEGMKVSVWNRTYEFGPNGLPSQITTAGKGILAGPVSINLVRQGKSLEARRGEAKLATSSPTAAVIESVAAGDGPRFSVASTVEFDGMMRIDFTLEPGESPMDIDGFTIQFPFKYEHALYVDAPVAHPPFHHVLDKDGWKMDRNFITGGMMAAEVFGRFWLGDDDRGIDFSFLSDEGWKPYDRPDVIHIERSGDRVNVDLRILGRMRLDKPARGTLLVTATPVRPFPRDTAHNNIFYCDGRPMKVVEGVDTYSPEGLKAFRERGGGVISLSDQWSYGYGRPEPFDPPGLKKFVDAARKLGIKIIIYVGGINGCWVETGPETPYLGEWEEVPSFRVVNTPRPDQVIIGVCMTSANGGHDCFIHLLDRMIREYDIDGIYIDGSGWFPSTNLTQGFGYLDGSGKPRPTSTILEIRKLYKRVTNLFLSHGKQPIVVHHSSWMLAGPVDSFSTLHLTGEQLAYRANESTAFPEDYFRIENTGRQWGLPVEVLVYNGPLMQRYMANTYIHGCAPAAAVMSGSSFRIAPDDWPIQQFSPHWKAFRAFDVAGAEWIPYWKAGALARSGNSAHNVSLYRHPKDGLLLLVGNTSRQPGRASIQLDWQALGLDPAQARVATVNKDRQVFELKNGLLLAALDGDDFVMLHVTAR